MTDGEADAATLTLHAKGPAVVERDHDTEVATVTETREADLHATFDVDAEWLREEASVHKQGAVISTKDVAELATTALSDDDVEYSPDETDEWELTLAGRVGDYLDVAIGASKDRHSHTATSQRVATTAVCILESLAEFAENQRPVLGMYDLAEQYDVDHHTLEDIRERLGDQDDSEDIDVDGDQEAEADA